MSDGAKYSISRIDVSLNGCNPNATWIGEAPGRYYEVFNKSDKGVKARSYGRLICRDVYPGIDWTFYFAPDGSLKHDFIVHGNGNHFPLIGRPCFSLMIDNFLIASWKFKEPKDFGA
jgi:hypothetical protein